MATLGWHSPRDPVQELRTAIDECELVWGDDPAYRQIRYDLDKVEQQLDLVTASPGRRATLRAAQPNPAGQEPQDRSEPPSEAEKGY